MTKLFSILSILILFNIIPHSEASQEELAACTMLMKNEKELQFNGRGIFKKNLYSTWIKKHDERWNDGRVITGVIIDNNWGKNRLYYLAHDSFEGNYIAIDGTRMANCGNDPATCKLIMAYVYQIMDQVALKINIADNENARCAKVLIDDFNSKI